VAMTQTSPSPDQYLVKCERCGLIKTAARLRNHKGAI